MFVGEVEFGNRLKLSIAEAKGITRRKLAKALYDAPVQKEVQVKSTVRGTADGRLKLVEAIECKFI